jgi:hypothetical protein
MSLVRRLLDPHILLILVFSLFAWAPLLTPAYFFRAHDAPHSIFYLVEFDQTLRDGFLWPRWAPDFAFGYGYPLFNIYAPLAVYAAEILHLLGLSFVTSVKTMYALATVGAGLTMYLFVRRLLGRDAGLLSAVVYMVVPFHLVEIFVRSAYSEFVALALLPLVLLAFTEAIATPSPGRMAGAGLAYGALALTHHTTFFAFTPFLIIYIAYLLIGTWRAKGLKHTRRVALHTLGGGLLGLALSAIYLLPMLAELQYVKVEQWTAYNYNYDQNFVYFSQLLSPYWGYGYSGPGLEDGMSFQLGAVMGVLVVFGGWLSLTRRFPHRGTALFFLAATAVIVWLMTPAAQFAWQALPIASLVQFPWRLLGLSSLTMSVGAGSLLARGLRDPGNHRTGESSGQVIDKSGTLSPSLLVVLLVIILGSFSYTLPQYTPVEPWREQPQAVIRWDRFSPTDRVGMVTYTQQQPTTGPMESQYLEGTPLQVAGILNGTGTVETLRHGGASDELLVRADGPVTVQFYTYDYPGWQVAIDGRPVTHQHQPPYGLISVDVPTGEHYVSLRMTTTPPRTVGSAISLIAALAIGAGLLGERTWRRLLCAR